jgi:hypothetical protein
MLYVASADHTSERLVKADTTQRDLFIFFALCFGGL